MQHTLMLGATVRCTDGKAGTISGLIINPNRNHVDYLVLRASDTGEHEYVVPSGQIQRASARELSLPCTWSELKDLPHPERPARQGSVVSNLSDLIVAREQTIVRDTTGDRLGVFHGAIVDSNLEVQAMLLANAPDKAIPIVRLARQGDDTGDLVVYLAQQMMHADGAPVI